MPIFNRVLSLGGTSKNLPNSKPRGITLILLSGQTPKATSSFFTDSLTVKILAENKARNLSIRMKVFVLSGPKYPLNTWPWNVWMIFAFLSREIKKLQKIPASLPMQPALAVCVWIMFGRSAKIIFRIFL